MAERINMTIADDLRDRFEAWRAEQYRHTGRIPSLADAARILIHKGLMAEAEPPSQKIPGPPSPPGPIPHKVG